jgi:8-oxo-dGTP pyrophosphatase MutT (NUDIX family)
VGTGQGFRQLDERVVRTGHIVTLVEATFAGPDGERFEREIVRHPGAVAVVPVLDDGTVVLVRQYRAALDAELLEIPAGKRDVAGEAPEVTANRELAEEVGWRAGRLVELVGLHNSVGFCDERCTIYLGTELVAAERDVHGPEEVHMAIEHLPLAEAVALVERGEITDAKTVAGLLLAARRLLG